MANIITNSEVGEIANPKFRKLLLRVVREIELSIEKVAANHAKPNEFPLPTDPNSTERILAARFSSLPKTVKDRSGGRSLDSLNASSEVRLKRFGDLAKVNLKTNASIGSQVKALPLPAELKLTIGELTGVVSGNDDNAVLPSPQMTKLEFRLHKVRCLDETGSSFREKFGNDEIDLGGNAVDETGDSHNIPKFRVGSNFDDGEQVSFSPPRQFTRFDLTEGTIFPKSYFVTMVLAEIDQGGLSEFQLNLLAKVKEKVIAELIKAGIAILPGGPIAGAIIGAAIAFVVGKIFDLLVRIWEDDIFQPIAVRVDIPSLNARFLGGKTDSPEAVATFSGHGGKYQVTYDWRVFA